MAGENAVIIKRVKKGGHGGHHGGAWKVAYADFVTAMMAFFLLMWLINTTTPEQKSGVSTDAEGTSPASQTTSDDHLEQSLSSKEQADFTSAAEAIHQAMQESP